MITNSNFRTLLVSFFLVFFFVYLNPLSLFFLESYFGIYIVKQRDLWLLYSVSLFIVGFLCYFQPPRIMNWIYKKNSDERTFPKRKLFLWIGLVFILFSLSRLTQVIYRWYFETYFSL